MASITRFLVRRWPVVAAVLLAAALVAIALAWWTRKEGYSNYADCKAQYCGGVAKDCACRDGGWKESPPGSGKKDKKERGGKKDKKDKGGDDGGGKKKEGGGGEKKKKGFPCKVTEYSTDINENDGWDVTSQGVDLDVALKNKTIATKDGKWMGQKMRVEYGGKTFDGTVGDICGPCTENHVDVLVNNPNEEDPEAWCTLL